MKSYVIALGIGIIIVAIFGVVIKMHASPTAVPNAPSETSSQSQEKRQSVVLNELNASGQSGAVFLKDLGSTVEVKVVTNLPQGLSATTHQPAHINLGACPTPGTLLYPLNDLVNGESTTVLNTTINNIYAKLPLAVIVHTSTANLQTYSTCGDFTSKK